MLFLATKEKNLLKKIAQQYSLELILLFGSRVSEKTHKESDYDIAYLSKKNLDLMEEAKLICDFMPVFKSDKVDLANLKKVPPLLLFAATNDCQVLYEKNSLIFPTLSAYAFKKYIETKPLYEEKFKRLQKRLEKIKLK
jgi:predicted nucleotidyltransferase